MAEEENESDEQATHQNMRFTVRLRIVHSVGAHTVPQPRHNESSSAEDDEDDLPLATALPAAATGTTFTSAAIPAAAADNCCEVCLIGQRDRVALIPL